MTWVLVVIVFSNVIKGITSARDSCQCWVLVVIVFLNVMKQYIDLALFSFLQLLLSVGTKLEHVITEIAHNVAEKYFAIGGDLIVMPSDDYFWFHRPRILLFLIHLILFQNAFDIAFIFWLFVSCLEN